MKNSLKLVVILLIVFIIVTMINWNKDIIPENTLGKIHLQVFRGQMSYTFFNKLSKCEKYTSPINARLGLVTVIPFIVQEKTKILGIENNSCHVVTYSSTCSGSPWIYGDREYFIPLDFSKELGIFLSNYIKHPKKRADLKKNFYSKHSIYSYCNHGNRKFHECMNKEDKELLLLNLYIVDNFNKGSSILPREKSSFFSIVKCFILGLTNTINLLLNFSSHKDGCTLYLYSTYRNC